MPPIRRVRQHVNPLSSKYANPAEVPDWSEVFANSRLPLHLDIGCGKGDFVREMAARGATASVEFFGFRDSIAAS